MQQPITGFHRDAEGHWVADLACGHGQHVRHDPPWQVREWVLEERTRQEHLGSLLNCVRCDEAVAAGVDGVPAGLTAAEALAYVDARLRGLCHEGALEASRRPPDGS